MKGMAMTQTKHGDTVLVHYTGQLDDGSEFDSSRGRDPLRVTIGNGEVIPGFDRALVGMTPGDNVRVNIPMNDAYGEHQPQLVAVVNADEFPEDIAVQIGQIYEIQQSEDQTVLVSVTEVTEDTVTLDANHPLAGKDLTFDISLVEIIQ
jgi:FKBP-type peptidyl-prolyl cis-trans isomerase 2